MSRHLGLQLSAYVDRRLDAATLRAFDQHLVACQVCRHAADQERRLLTSLRHGATPGVSEGLQSMLLGMAAAQPPRGTPIPIAPRSRQAPVPTVSLTMPGLHRSPRRAAMLAGFAATASAAAAIGLAVAGPVASASSPTLPGGGGATGTATITSDRSAVLISRVGSVRTIVTDEDDEKGGGSGR